VPASVLLPVVLFVAMGAVTGVILWRLMAAGGAARRSAQSLRTASDVAHRSEARIGQLAAELDGLRQRGLEPETAGDILAAGATDLSSLAAEARSARDRTSQPAVAALVDELERALRSLELIDHGRQVMIGGDHSGGEGRTSVKRGYLNLLHVREAIRQRGAEIRAVSVPVNALRATRRS
jgi:hypothetical protein